MAAEKSPFRLWAGRLHLWLGGLSGLIVFVTAVTGALYCFREEIESLYDDHKYVAVRNEPLLPPSRVLAIADSILPGRAVHGIEYGAPGRALSVIYYEAEPEFYQVAWLDPYDGTLRKLVDMESGFFHFVLDGHVHFWMGEGGRLMVGIATLVFLIVLVSGLILWVPRSRKQAAKRIRFEWNPKTGFKRRIYDLHHILGFYVYLVAFVVALTGAVMAFETVAEGVYKAIGGDKTAVFDLPKNAQMHTASAMEGAPVIDRIWFDMMREYDDAASVELHPPPAPEYGIYVLVRYSDTTYWDADYRYFDGIGGQELEAGTMYGRRHRARIPDTILMANYDVHVGAIAGLPGKVLVFLSALVVASLPVTGFMIWWGRRG